MPSKIKQCMMKKLPKSQQFDKLLGLTYGLNEYDCWVFDHEMSGEGEELDLAIQQLGKAWRELLSCSDDVLGITDEFTRPGTLKILERLRKTIDEYSGASGDEYIFDYGQKIEGEES